jgi:predicted alpha/beta superfamily hydrolase
VKPPALTQVKPAFISHARELGTNYPIYADVPAGRKPFRAVLLMDGDFFFDPAVAAAQELARAGRIPPVAVFGVGYGASFGQPGNHRGRDYTPTTAAEEPGSGRAGKFLGYLQDTLWPELSDRYPLKQGERMLAGHSLGSLLVLYALFQPDPFFTLALASAPSIWWDDRSILAQVKALRQRQAVLKGKLYLGVGAADTPSMLGDLALLEQELKERPFRGLSVVSRRFANRDHFNSPPDSLRSGLADLLG